MVLVRQRQKEYPKLQEVDMEIQMISNAYKEGYVESLQRGDVDYFRLQKNLMKQNYYFLNQNGLPKSANGCLRLLYTGVIIMMQFLN